MASEHACICGGKTEIQTGPYKTTWGGAISEDLRGVELVVPNVSMYHCLECGEDFFDTTQAKYLDRGIRRAMQERIIALEDRCVANDISIN